MAKAASSFFYRWLTKMGVSPILVNSKSGDRRMVWPLISYVGLSYPVTYAILRYFLLPYHYNSGKKVRLLTSYEPYLSPERCAADCMVLAPAFLPILLLESVGVCADVASDWIEENLFE